MFNKKLIYILFLIFFYLGYSQDKSAPTEIWSPIPIKVDAKNFLQPPSDAIILFDGKDFSNWVTQYSNKIPEWKINQDGSMTVVNGKGGIKTKETFGSVQLHIEWKTTNKGLENHNNQKRYLYFSQKFFTNPSLWINIAMKIISTRFDNFPYTFLLF